MKNTNNVVSLRQTVLAQPSLDDCIKELNCVNRKVSHLLTRKDELVEHIIELLGHNHEGQKSYEHGNWKIEVKTVFSYSLNRKLYESGNFDIPKKYNPIKKSVAYSVSKTLCDHALQVAPLEVRDMLAELIDKKPSKANVTLKERV